VILVTTSISANTDGSRATVCCIFVRRAMSNFISPEFRRKFQREIPLFLDIPYYP